MLGQKKFVVNLGGAMCVLAFKLAKQSDLSVSQRKK